MQFEADILSSCVIVVNLQLRVAEVAEWQAKILQSDVISNGYIVTENNPYSNAELIAG